MLHRASAVSPCSRAGGVGGSSPELGWEPTKLTRASYSAVQADVEVSFEVSSSALAGAEPQDPALAYDAERLCGVKRADVKGGAGPFGLWVLASANLKERTAVFFRVFKAAGSNKPVVLMCTDPTK